MNAMPSPVPDTVLRIALASMATDPTASLTDAQRAWLLALPARRTPLTPDERACLRPCLLAYAEAHWPGSGDILARQFTAPSGEPQDAPPASGPTVRAG